MRSWLTAAMVLGACADDAASEDLRCERGPELASAAVATFAASGPACSRDDECTSVNTTVECVGLRVGSCGTVVHRDIVSQWNPRTVCPAIERLPNESGLSCDLSPSCAASEPACLDGRCSSRR